jgi:hypothetical protein
LGTSPSSVDLFLTNQKINQTADIIGVGSSERAIRVARLYDRSISAHEKFTRLNDVSSIFPPRTDAVRKLAGNTFSNRER